MIADIWRDHKFNGEIDIPNSIVNEIIANTQKGDLFNQKIAINFDWYINPQIIMNNWGDLWISAGYIKEHYPEFYDEMVIKMVGDAL